MNDTTGLRSSVQAGGATPTESLIDRESHFTGNYRTPHDLRIEGRYEGDIECRGTVFVGETANVTARVIAGNVTVAGKFDGEIVCETRFEILRTGRVSGSVSSAVTIVHDGAFYQGELRMVRPGAEAAPRGNAADTPRERAATAAPPRSMAAQTVRMPIQPEERPQPAPPQPAPPPRRRAAEAAAPTAEPEMPASLAAGSPSARGVGATNGRNPPVQEAE
ncbi:MAG: polymer-forming cytoskeletal protein [Chloroflexi bacterium]|nr:polymer-forming cytoskeletal protein [Chloroflexota bacterium]